MFQTMQAVSLCFKIVSLNVYGLISKMKYSEFRELLVSNDIICLTKTKMDNCDFDGCVMKNRSTCKRKSWVGGGVGGVGGIAVLVRNEIMGS